MNLLRKLFGNYSEREIKRVTPLLDKTLALEEEYKNYSAKGSQKQEWVERLKQGQGVNELDRGLISFLIDRIEVFEGGRLWIKYRFAADF